MTIETTERSADETGEVGAGAASRERTVARLLALGAVGLGVLVVAAFVLGAVARIYRPFRGC